MKILMVGAGALGGYFGARLLEAGRDVTFLLRPGRIAQLSVTGGLQIASTYGDITIATPKVILSEQIDSVYDLIMVSCKSYDLDSCMAAFAPAIGPNTMILPFLNGVEHIDKLINRFGQQTVLGGVVLISATLDNEGRILHLNSKHSLLFGELDGRESVRINAVRAALGNTKFDAKYSQNIAQELWNKWVFLASLAGATGLFRASVGDIERAGASHYTLQLFSELVDIAKDNGFEVNAKVQANLINMLVNADSDLTASMMKDIEKQGKIEADSIITDFVRRARPEKREQYKMLQLVDAYLKSYLNRRAREARAR